MQSRTPEGKHTKRFIVLLKLYANNTVRSQNIPEFFATKEEAQAAIADRGAKDCEYRVRQK